MIRIFISPEIEEMAQEYADALKSKFPAVAKLNELRAHLARRPGFSRHVAYLDDVIDKYDSILIAKPSDAENVVTGLNKDDYIVDTPRLPKYDEHGNPKNVGTAKFYKLVSEEMGYEWVRNHLMPEYIRRLGIKSCVYCNAQYGVSVRRADKTYTSSYELDHYRPQKLFPHLSTSFFNLQPSCSHCNKTKSWRDAKFNLYTEDYTELRPFSFRLSKDSILKFLLFMDDERLEIVFDSTDTPLKQSQEELFKVSKKYEWHKDEAADLVILSKIYNDSFFNQLRNSVKTAYPQFFHRYLDAVLGFPIDGSKVHKRPLTLMKQHIAKQLGLM